MCYLVIRLRNRGLYFLLDSEPLEYGGAEMVGNPVRRRPVVLLIEYNVSVRESLHLILDEEYVVVDANEIPEALAMLQHRKVDLILLDLLLPNSDTLLLLLAFGCFGFETPPVVVLSGLDSAAPAVAKVRFGALDYAIKPFDNDELVETVRDVVGSAVKSAVTTATKAHGCPLLLLVGLPLGARASLAVILGDRFRIHSAAGIADALASAGSIAPDLVVLDEANESLGRRSGSLERIRAVLLPRQTLVIASEDERFLSAAWPGGCAVLRGPLPLTELAGEIYRLLSPTGANWTRYSRPVKRALDSIADCYVDVTIEELGRQLAIAPYYLSRLFRAEVGITLKSYLGRVAVEASKCLLLETDDTVDAIASSVGFHDWAHLSRLFVRLTGIRPSVYRRVVRPRPTGLKHDRLLRVGGVLRVTLIGSPSPSGHRRTPSPP